MKPIEQPDDAAALVAWETILTLAREYRLGVHKERATEQMIVLATPAYQRARQVGPYGRRRR